MNAYERSKAAETSRFSVLVNAAVGLYKCSKWYQVRRRGGWLSVERDEGTTTVMWTSGKTTHCPFAGPAQCVDIDADGRLEAYYETTLSLWMKWGPGRGGAADHRRGLVTARWMEDILRGAVPHNG